jgi:mevalonate kinase
MTTKPVNHASACGKTILSGEYAVVFGFPGIAVPTKERLKVAFKAMNNDCMTIQWSEVPEIWLNYTKKILNELDGICRRRGKHSAPLQRKGILHIESDLPLGKGMGSSTALVIALCRYFLGNDCRPEALEIENAVNPGNSGIDFAVIWEEKPILFRKGTAPRPINLPANILNKSRLIDSGTPNEATPALVAWVRSRYESGDKRVCDAIETIGRCTERIVAGESLKTVMRDHHRAQVALGVVTPEAQKIIAEIEKKGEAAKVLGAGARTGGGGMILEI